MEVAFLLGPNLNCEMFDTLGSRGQFTHRASRTCHAPRRALARPSAPDRARTRAGAATAGTAAPPFACGARLRYETLPAGAATEASRRRNGWCGASRPSPRATRPATPPYAIRHAARALPSRAEGLRSPGRAGPLELAPALTINFHCPKVRGTTAPLILDGSHTAEFLIRNFDKSGRAEARWSMFECNSSSETRAGAYTILTNTNEGTRVRQAAAARTCVGPN